MRVKIFAYLPAKHRRHLVITVCVVALALLVGLFSPLVSRAPAIETAAWGLHFEQSGDVPDATASQSQLDDYGAAYLGDTTQQVLYLTFDAGYEAGYTAGILDVLRAHNVKAAFFVVGHYIETQPDLVRRMAEEGHIVGNHTYHHPDMSQIADKATFTEELESLRTLYEETTGREMSRYYRPPQGVYSEENLQMANELGYHTIFWSLAYADWNADDQPTADEAFSKLLPRTHNGAIILLHATSKTNAEILDELLTRWEELGYTFGTLDDLFAA